MNARHHQTAAMKLQQTPLCLAAGLALLLSLSGAAGQGTFRNLDFESANLPLVFPGQSGGSVSSIDALPGWTAFLGTNQVTQVLYNDATLGNASIDIVGIYWRYGGTVEGSYTLILQPGSNPFSGNINDYIDSSVEQTGLVPASAKSIQLKASGYSFSVSFAGQALSLIPMGTGANYTLYGADISSFAGQVGTLRLTGLTTLAQPSTTDSFDSIVFSTQAIPEPGVFGLAALGALLLGWRVLRRLQMRLQTPAWLVGGLAVLLSAWGAVGQSSFQNLGFESASLIPIPGDPYARVQFATAFPGWTGLVGGAKRPPPSTIWRSWALRGSAL